MSKKKLSFIGLFLSVSFLMTGQKRDVSLQISYYQPYCGGARPSKEIEANAKKPMPYASKTLVLVSSGGKIDSARTDKGGFLKMKLAPGTYKVFESWRYRKSTPGGDAKTNYNDACLKEEWKKESLVITVTKTGFSSKEIRQIIAYCDWNRPCLKDEKKLLPQ